MRLVRYSYPNYRSLSPVFGGYNRSSWPGLDTEIDRLFGNVLGEFAGSSANSRFPVDLFEDQANTYVRAELPGVNRNDINVEVVDGYLTITARKTAAAVANAPVTATAEQATENKTEQTGQTEQAAKSVSFSRSVALNDTVQADQVSAAYENGVLTVTLPKREEAKPKKVTVAVK